MVALYVLIAFLRKSATKNLKVSNMSKQKNKVPKRTSPYRINEKWHCPSISGLEITDWTETIEDGRFNVMIDIRIEPDGTIKNVINYCATNPMHTPKYSMVCPHCNDFIEFELEHVGMTVKHTPDPDKGVCGGKVILIPNPKVYTESWMWAQELYENTHPVFRDNVMKPALANVQEA